MADKTTTMAKGYVYVPGAEFLSISSIDDADTFKSKKFRLVTGGVATLNTDANTTSGIVALTFSTTDNTVTVNIGGALTSQAMSFLLWGKR